MSFWLHSPLIALVSQTQCPDKCSLKRNIDAFPLHLNAQSSIDAKSPITVSEPVHSLFFATNNQPKNSNNRINETQMLSRTMSDIVLIVAYNSIILFIPAKFLQ